MYSTSEASVASSLLCCCCCCGLVAFCCVRKGKSSFGDSSFEPFPRYFSLGLLVLSGPLSNTQRLCGDLVSEKEQHLIYYLMQSIEHSLSTCGIPHGTRCSLLRMMKGQSCRTMRIMRTTHTGTPSLVMILVILVLYSLVLGHC